MPLTELLAVQLEVLHHFLQLSRVRGGGRWKACGVGGGVGFLFLIEMGRARGGVGKWVDFLLGGGGR